jgi:hypothetical protein
MSPSVACARRTGASIVDCIGVAVFTVLAEDLTGRAEDGVIQGPIGPVTSPGAIGTLVDPLYRGASRADKCSDGMVFDDRCVPSD